jgi:lysine 6-dehydrogenase
MKYAVIGAGLMGSAAAHDLAMNNPHDEVVLADINIQRASESARGIGPNVRSQELDVNDHEALIKVLSGADAAISAVSYTVNYQISRAAIDAGVHMCDLGGNNDTVQKQLALDSEAKKNGVTIVPNCGLAPGITSVLVMKSIKQFDEIDSIKIRVGGLPQQPRPPLNYQVLFGVEGLINEYIERVVVISDGKVASAEPLADLEEIQFPDPFNALEAFNTSGGTSILPQLLVGKVNNLNYKTIRYKGHCEKFRTLLELGFASSEPITVGSTVKTTREFFEALLRKKLDYGGKDVVLARVTTTGLSKGLSKTLAYEFVDYYDDATRITAMMRTTAFPTSIIAQLLAHGTVQMRGVLPPELCVPGDIMITDLKKRNVNIKQIVT